jgi:hypothetical protein
MAELRDALLFLELDRGGESAGPLFDEPRRRLERDPELRAAWAMFQALRVLAVESAPAPDERLIRQALAQCRQERIQRQLARATGSEDLAREILLGRVKKSRGVPAWAMLLLLAGGLGLLWLGFDHPWREGRSSPRFENVPPAASLPLPFEFPAETPVQAALAMPEAAGLDSEDVKHESEAARQARRLLRQQLRARSAELGPKAPPAPPAEPRAESPAKGPLPSFQRDPTSVPSGTATPWPTPTISTTSNPTPAAEPSPAPPSASPTIPSPAPTPAPTPQRLEAQAEQAALRLSAPDVDPGQRLWIDLDLPEQHPVDLRLFDQRGRPIRSLWDGPLGPGRIRLPLDAVDEQWQALSPGTYYLRVMTHWFSRVEPVQVKP